MASHQDLLSDATIYKWLSEHYGISQERLSGSAELQLAVKFARESLVGLPVRSEWIDHVAWTFEGEWDCDLERWFADYAAD